MTPGLALEFLVQGAGFLRLDQVIDALAQIEKPYRDFKGCVDLMAMSRSGLTYRAWRALRDQRRKLLKRNRVCAT